MSTRTAAHSNRPQSHRLDLASMSMRGRVAAAERDFAARSEASRRGWRNRKAAAPSCDRCNSTNLARIKGCIRCLKCGFRFDCNGW